MKFRLIKMITAVVLPALVLGAALNHLRADKPDPDALRQKAEEAFERRSYNTAIKFYNQFLQTKPADKDAHQALYDIGKSYEGLRNHHQTAVVWGKLIGKSKRFRNNPELREKLYLYRMQHFYNFYRSNPDNLYEIFTKIDPVRDGDETMALNKKAGNINAQARILKQMISFKENYQRYLYQKKHSKDVEYQTNWAEHLFGQHPNAHYNHQQNLGLRGQGYMYRDLLKMVDEGLKLKASDQLVHQLYQTRIQLIENFVSMKSRIDKNYWPAELDDVKTYGNDPAERGLALQEEITKRFAGSDFADQAYLQMARIWENNKRDYVKAIEILKKIPDRGGRENYKYKNARNQIASFRRSRLGVTVNYQNPANTDPGYRWTARNLKEIDFALFAVDLFDVLKSQRAPNDVQSYDLSKLKPLKTWTVKTGDKGVHQFLSNGNKSSDLPVSKSNAYILRATGKGSDGTSFEIRQPYMISDLAMVTKSDQYKTLAYVTNAKTGAPETNAKVLAQYVVGHNYRNARKKYTNYIYGYKTLTTDENGLAEFDHEDYVKNSGFKGDHLYKTHTNVMLVAKKDDRFAHLGNIHGNFSQQNQSGQNLTYSYTDRPVYRPGQTVHFKSILRQRRRHDFAVLPGKRFEIEARDPRGNSIFKKELTTSELGTLSDSITLKDDATLGQYNVQIREVYGKGKKKSYNHHSGLNFRVEEYKRPEYQVTITPEKDTYQLGDKVRAKVHGEYYFGGGVANAKVDYQVYRSVYHYTYTWQRPYQWYYGKDYGRRPSYRYGRSSYPYYQYQARRDLVASGTVTTDEKGDAWITFDAKSQGAVGNHRAEARFNAKDSGRENDQLLKLKSALRDRSYYPDGVSTSNDTFAKRMIDAALAYFGIPIDKPVYKIVNRDDLQFSISANMVDSSRRNIASSTNLRITRQPFYVSAHVDQKLYQPGEEVEVKVSSQNADGRPVGFKGEAHIEYVTHRPNTNNGNGFNNQIEVETIDTKPVTVGADGKGSVKFKVSAKGYYRLRISTPNPWVKESDGPKNIEGSAFFWIAKEDGDFARYVQSDLEVIMSKDVVQPGEKARIMLLTNHDNAHALITVESDRLKTQKLVKINKSSHTFELPIEAAFEPNVTIGVTMVRKYATIRRQQAVRIPPTNKFLTIKLKTEKEEFLPGEKAQVDITVVDRDGKPVQAELSLGAIDSSLFYIQSSTRGDIRPYFHNRSIYNGVRTILTHNASSTVPSPKPGFANGNFGRQSRNKDMKKTSSEAMRSGGMPPSMPTASKDDAISGMLELKSRQMSVRKESEGGLGSPDPGNQPLAQTEVRKDFRETALWLASVNTDANGKATADITFPDSLTTWRLTAIGADKETRVGEVKTDLITRKNILVRLQAPRFFVETDQVVLSAIAHNSFDKEANVKVVFNLSSHLQSLDGSQTHEVMVKVPAGGERRVDLTCQVMKPGQAKIQAKALSTKESDAMEMTFPVVEYGTEKLLVTSGILYGDAEQTLGKSTITIPAKIRPGSQSIRIEASPTIAGVMLSSLPYLIEYPYGCTEQTMSRFLPAVLARHSLSKLGMNIADTKKLIEKDPTLKGRLKHWQKNPVFDSKKLDKVILAGIKRLKEHQNPNGGWGWWKRDQSNAYLTSYVMSGLADARDAGLVFPEGMFERGVQALRRLAVQDKISRYRWHDQQEPSLRCYVLYALSKADPTALTDKKIAKQLTGVYDDRDDLNDYSRALLALTLAEAGREKEAGIVVDNIKDRVQKDKETGHTTWGHYRNYYYWYHGGTEATAYSLKALLAVQPDDPMVRSTVNWLLRHRRGTRWFNTKDTATVCYAFADYLAHTRELEPDQTVTVKVNGKAIKTFTFNAENVLTGETVVEIAGDSIGVGPMNVTIERKGVGNVYWNASAEFFTKEEKITSAGNEIFVEREYFQLVEKKIEKTRKVFDATSGKYLDEKFTAMHYERKKLEDGAKITSGDQIEVVLHIEAKNNFEYVMFEDPKPAGCEPVALKSGHTWGGGMGSHMELRDQKLAFFATYVPKGKHTIKYKLRAEIPGTFHALPSHAESMYAPLVKANSASHIIGIDDMPAHDAKKD